MCTTSVQRYPAASATDTQSPLWMSVMPRIVPTGNSMLLILEPLKACSTFAWLGSGSRVPHQQEDTRDQQHQDGCQAGPEQQAGEDTETNVEHWALQTDRAREGRSFRQTAKARWQAAGCLGACARSTPTPKVAATK